MPRTIKEESVGSRRAPKASTREQLLVCARRLFNEKGYSNVSMRMLADELGIGVGNVTYYFGHKQDIVTALMQDAFDQTRVEGEITSLEQLTDMFSRMLDTLTRHTFFFLDPEFIQDERHIAHNGYLRGRLRSALGDLTNAGFFLSTFTEEVRNTLLDLLLMTHLTWLRQSMRAAQQRAMSKAALLQAHWLVFAPYLSDKGRAALENMKKCPPPAEEKIADA